MQTIVASLVLILLAGPVLSAQDQAATQPTFAGSWTLTAETDNGQMTFALVLEQDGEKVTGTFATGHGNAPLAGTVGDGVLKLVGPDGTYFELTATLNDDGTLSGSFASDIANAKFTGTRSGSPASGA